MENSLKKGFIFLFLVVVCVSLASAEYKVFNASIEKVNYAGGENVKGKFFMNFSNQANVNFTNNLGNYSISLLDLLEKEGYSSGDEFNCNPSNCVKGFTSSNGQTSKSMVLSGSKMFGFSLTGKNAYIKDEGITFNITSNALSSCANQISIDFFDDGIVDILNDNYVNETCTEKNYGCFDSGGATEELGIGEEPYCEKITLPRAPAYKVGAKIKRVGVGTSQATIELFDAKTGEGPLQNCNLALPVGEEYQNVECILDYPSKEQSEYFVCISASPNIYRIRTENDNPCGMENPEPYQEFQQDYEIYAQSLKYGAVSMKINEKSFQEMNNGIGLTESAYNYMNEVYGAMCEPECAIPFKISSGVSEQNIEIKGIDIKYGADGKSNAFSNNVYDISEKNLTLSSSNLEFDFENLGINTLNANGPKTLEVRFGGNEIFEKLINISASFSFDIVPKVVLIGQSTSFKIINSQNITSSVWDFGDGSQKVNSNGNSATHTFTQDKNFEIEVTAVGSGATSTKKFTVVVGDAKTSANVTLKRYESRLANITNQINSFPKWISDEIKKGIDPAQIETSLDIIREDFESATKNEDYVKIVSSLAQIDVPMEVSYSIQGTLPAEIGFEGIDSSLISEVSSEEVDASNEEVKEAIVNWISENYIIDLEYQLISAVRDSGREDLFTKIKVRIDKKGNSEDEAYLIINYPKDGIIFAEDYSQRALSEGSAVSIYNQDPEDFDGIEFILPEKIEVENLGIYLSPEVSKLSITGGIGNQIIGKFKVAGFITWMVILALAFLIVYIILQEWYKRYYEGHLFPNRDDLYNMINFIYNGRAQGLQDYEIRKKLSSSGWSGERITYALRKIDGKRTGMWEIPLFKFFENNKVKKEIQKRQKMPLDARFIKRPIF